jgi:UDP:flavonoid glycosyltransferase YjiC (YdhE family)
MHVILVSLGGRGDTLPFLALGRELLARGHRVTLAANGALRSLARKQGLEFIEALPAAVYEDFAARLAQRSDLEVFRAMVETYVGLIPSVYQIVMDNYSPGESVVAAQAYALGARIARDKHGIRLATIHLQPLWFRSAYDPLGFWQHLPRGVSRAMGRLIDAVADRMIAPAANAFRARLELPPVSRLLHRWWHSPDLVIGMFPSWFRAPQPDWPPRSVLVGFPRSLPMEPVDLREVEAFLSAGPAPLVFNQSAIVGNAGPYYRAAIDAVRRLGQRAIFISPDMNAVPSTLPDEIKCFAFVPLEQLLPRCRAHIYHGGISSMALTLAAGIPHLTVPKLGDQPDNSARLLRLGVSRNLSPRQFTGRRVAAALRRLLSSSEVAQRCQHYAALSRQSDGSQGAALALEALFAQTGQ